MKNTKKGIEDFGHLSAHRFLINALDNISVEKLDFAAEIS
jgi:hypothetical protein